MLKLALAAGASLLFLCACSSHTQTYRTADGSVTVEAKDKDGGTVHITGKDGASVDINTGKPITGYPTDVPLYAGKSVMDVKSAEKHSHVVTLETSDSVQKITDFYKLELASKGWKTEGTMSSDQMTMYTAAKDDRKLVIIVSSNGTAQTISQTLADK